MALETIVAVLSNNRVGLFRLLEVDKDVLWFRGVFSEIRDWVRPSATLYHDPRIIEPQIERIHVYTEEVLRYRTDGAVFPNYVRSLVRTRIPYLACFYEILDPYPVYFLDNDSILPWPTTLSARVDFFREVKEYKQNLLTTLPRVLSETAICPITLESLQKDDALWTPCGHVFSSMALQTALTRNNRCPMCRADVNIQECVGISMDD
jgi:hypothetical protein